MQLFLSELKPEMQLGITKCLYTLPHILRQVLQSIYGIRQDLVGQLIKGILVEAANASGEL